MTTTEHLPLYSIEAEEHLLSCCFIDGNDVVAKCVQSRIGPLDFYIPANRVIFETVIALFNRRAPIDLALVAEELRASGSFEAVGGFAYLAQVSGRIPTTAQADQFIETVRDLARLRKIQAGLSAALEATLTSSGTWSDRFDAILPHVRAIQDVASPKVTRDLAAIVEATKAQLSSPVTPGIPGPFAGWDREAGALKPGELAVLAGRPGTGKSVYGQMQATACLRSRRHAAFFSLEMSGEENLTRWVTQSLGNRASVAERCDWLDKAAASRLLHLFDGGPASTLSGIEARCRLLAARPEGLGLIVIDYLQLVAPPPEVKRDTRERQVATISRALKLLALDLRVPILLLAQLNRDVEKEDRRPRLSDLRESGAIEQDADAVWFLHPVTPTGPVNAADEIVDVDLIQAKRRSGQPGIVARLKFNRPCVRFQTS
ncbi:replicative DNA helicase [Nibricoccus aquaticus]|nr:DnaB-like helicase C-terminal domain-containing protein [Nibricoccus aquaticus]